MFNLIIKAGADSFESSPVQLERARVVTEYTSDEVTERYRSLDGRAVEELKSFPTLFVPENEEAPARVGYVNEVKVCSETVSIKFEYEETIPPFGPGMIKSHSIALGLGKLELSRTHWAVKEDDLWRILVEQGFLHESDVSKTKMFCVGDGEPNNAPAPPGSDFNNRQIFIVHGHDEKAKLDMESFIRELGLEPVILHLQASGGRTIIEKIEKYTNVGFGIVLYTPCDIGTSRDSLQLHRRARQNVVFEHGYLIAKLGRERVAAVVKGDVEAPNDISGIIYINLDDQDKWKTELVEELRNAGYRVVNDA